jgi:glycosyltransferase involved in cell wall biosynthesis
MISPVARSAAGKRMPDTLSIPASNRQRLLIFNLRTDVDDHILGFTTRWINALAPHYTAIDVLTTHAGKIAVADNVRVYSAGREQGGGKIQRIAAFYGTLARLLIRHRYDACFAHMQPLFAALGAPLLALRGVPITTWYTHRERTRQLEWATRFSYRVVSAVPSSFPISTPKLRPLGHGIETDFFTPSPYIAARPRIVQVARLTAIKHQHILLQAAQPLDCEVVLVGDLPDGYGDEYKKRLHALVDELGMRARVIFAGAQTPEQVRVWYQSAAAAVNLSPAGLFDKAALESMSCAVPTLVSNQAFAPLLGAYHEQLLVSAPDDVEGVRERLRGLLALSGTQREQIGQHLRGQVIAQHSLQALIRKLICVMHSGELPADS